MKEREMCEDLGGVLHVAFIGFIGFIFVWFIFVDCLVGGQYLTIFYFLSSATFTFTSQIARVIRIALRLTNASVNAPPRRPLVPDCA
jgi:hypothetical protein